MAGLQNETGNTQHNGINGINGTKKIMTNGSTIATTAAATTATAATNGATQNHNSNIANMKNIMMNSNHKKQQEENGVVSDGTSTLLDTCLSLEAKVESFLSEKEDVLSPRLCAVQEQVKISMRVIREALTKWRPEELSLSYNGGKDCLVLLILVLASMPSVYLAEQRNGRDEQNCSANGQDKHAKFPKSLQSIYVVSSHPFQQVDRFVDGTAKTYSLDLSKEKEGSMKKSLQAHLDARPEVKAVLVGTRRTDPHGKELGFFDRTDSGWPDFTRVHPVIDWHYAEVWGFIRHLGIPYCSLYDMGYTSLGGTTDTHPNPALKIVESGTGDAAKFRPAYELYEDDAERLGRD